MIFNFIIVVSISLIISFDYLSQNPLEIGILLGDNLQLIILYTSQAGSLGNNIYIGLEELDSKAQFVRRIDGVSLENKPAGANVQLSPTVN